MINVTREASQENIVHPKKKGMFSAFLSARKKKEREQEEKKEKQKELLSPHEKDKDKHTETKVESTFVRETRPLQYTHKSVTKSSSFEHTTSELRPCVRRMKTGTGTDIDNAAAVRPKASFTYEPYEEQTVPVDDDEEHQVKRKKRKTKSTRITTSIDEEPIYARDRDLTSSAMKKKKKRHRTTDLTSRISKKADSIILDAKSSPSLSESGVAQRDNVTSPGNKKRQALRKSLAVSQSEYSKTSPYKAKP